MEKDEKAAPEDATALDMIAALAAPEAVVVDTPEAFLTGVAAALKGSDNVDADLAAILTDHLVTVTPHENVNARAAILTLAAKRATRAGEQPDG